MNSDFKFPVQLNAWPTMLRLCVVISLVQFALTSTAFAQPRSVDDVEQLELAPFVAPRICKAVVLQQDKQVFVQIWGAELLRGNQDHSKEGRGWVYAWTQMDKLEFERDIQAFKSSGEKLDQSAILEALKKPTTVACFARTNQADSQTPDPLYAQVFRDDVVLLVFDAKYWLRD